MLRLEDFCDIQSGGTPRRGVSEYYGGDIPWVKICDMDVVGGLVVQTEETITREGLKSINNRLFPKGTILLAMYGSVGKVAMAGRELSTNQAILGITIKEKERLEGRYLMRWLSSLQPKLLQRARGVTLKNISAEIVRELRIPVPPLNEQRRIAAILDKADEIRLKRRETERMWNKFLYSAFLELFGEPVSNSKGWSEQRLSEISDIQSGIAKGKDLRGKITQPVPYMRVANVQDGHIILDEVKSIEVLPSDVQRLRLLPGDVLLTEGGDPDKLGRGAVWRGEIDPCIHQNHIFRVRPDIKKVLPDYLSMLIGSARGKRYFLRAAKQTTGIATINRSQLDSLPVPVPPMALQVKFAGMVDKYREAESRLDKLRTSAEELFSALQGRLR